MEPKQYINGMFIERKDGTYDCYSTFGVRIPRSVLLEAAKTAPDYSVEDYWQMTDYAVRAENR